MIAFFNVYVQMILNNAYAHSTEGGQIRSLKFVHIYLQCKNNIFEIHKTAISRNYGKWTATCGMSDKRRIRFKLNGNSKNVIMQNC